MGFRCGLCGEAVEAGVIANKLVLRKRMREYPHRREVHKQVVLDEKGRKKDKWFDDFGGYGWEIAQEVLACAECARKFNAASRQDAVAKAG